MNRNRFLYEEEFFDYWPLQISDLLLLKNVAEIIEKDEFIEEKNIDFGKFNVKTSISGGKYVNFKGESCENTVNSHISPTNGKKKFYKISNFILQGLVTAFVPVSDKYNGEIELDDGSGGRIVCFFDRKNNNYNFEKYTEDHIVRNIVRVYGRGVKRSFSRISKSYVDRAVYVENFEKIHFPGIDEVDFSFQCIEARKYAILHKIYLYVSVFSFFSIRSLFEFEKKNSNIQILDYDTRTSEQIEETMSEDTQLQNQMEVFENKMEIFENFENLSSDDWPDSDPDINNENIDNNNITIFNFDTIPTGVDSAGSLEAKEENENIASHNQIILLDIETSSKPENEATEFTKLDENLDYDTEVDDDISPDAYEILGKKVHKTPNTQKNENKSIPMSVNDYKDSHEFSFKFNMKDPGNVPGMFGYAIKRSASEITVDDGNENKKNNKHIGKKRKTTKIDFDFCPNFNPSASVKINRGSVPSNRHWQRYIREYINTCIIPVVEKMSMDELHKDNRKDMFPFVFTAAELYEKNEYIRCTAQSVVKTKHMRAPPKWALRSLSAVSSSSEGEVHTMMGKGTERGSVFVSPLKGEKMVINAKKYIEQGLRGLEQKGVLLSNRVIGYDKTKFEIVHEKLLHKDIMCAVHKSIREDIRMKRRNKKTGTDIAIVYYNKMDDIEYIEIRESNRYEKGTKNEKDSIGNKRKSQNKKKKLEIKVKNQITARQVRNYLLKQNKKYRFLVLRDIARLLDGILHRDGKNSWLRVPDSDVWLYV